MAFYYRNKLSASTDGQGILVTSISASTPTTIHTAVSGTTNWDRIYLWAYNKDTYQRHLTLTLGSGAQRYYIPPFSGLVVLLDGQIMQNSDVLTANNQDDMGSTIILYGYVDEIRS